MSVVIVGGNECMVRRYKELCDTYNCKAKIYPKMESAMKDIGNPDLLVLFTNTVSHKMARCAVVEAERANANIIRCHTSSQAALNEILDKAAAV